MESALQVSAKRILAALRIEDIQKIELLNEVSEDALTSIAALSVLLPDCGLKELLE